MIAQKFQEGAKFESTALEWAKFECEVSLCVHRIKLSGGKWAGKFFFGGGGQTFSEHSWREVTFLCTRF